MGNQESYPTTPTVQTTTSPSLKVDPPSIPYEIDSQRTGGIEIGGRLGVLPAGELLATPILTNDVLIGERVEVGSGSWFDRKGWYQVSYKLGKSRTVILSFELFKFIECLSTRSRNNDDAHKIPANQRPKSTQPLDETDPLYQHQPKGERSYKNNSKIVHAYGPSGLAPLTPLNDLSRFATYY